VSATTRVYRTGEQPRNMGHPVMWSASLSCGCRIPPAGPVPLYEANGPGEVVICGGCDEYAIVVRVTHRLVLDRATATNWLAIGGQMDRDSAEAIAVEQGFGQAD
jgi:hypothetical protein